MIAYYIYFISIVLIYSNVEASIEDNGIFDMQQNIVNIGWNTL